jgi:hypothetical protein
MRDDRFVQHQAPTPRAESGPTRSSVMRLLKSVIGRWFTFLRPRHTVYALDGALVLGQLNIATEDTVLKRTNSSVQQIPAEAALRVDNSSDTANLGSKAAVLGTSDRGKGLVGVSQAAAGVLGVSLFSDLPGVAGRSGAFFNGVATGPGPGVAGSSGSGPGVAGTSNFGVGVVARSDAGLAIGARSESGTCIQASSGSSIGMLINGTIGVFAAGSQIGVIGRAESFDPNVPATGVLAQTLSPGGVAILAQAEPDPSGLPGTAGQFQGNVEINGSLRVNGGNLTVIGGLKSAAVLHPDGSHRLTYCLESPESWFEDFGRSLLTNGTAEVRLDPDFAALVETDDYHVFITPEGDSEGLYVSDLTPEGFQVRESHGGTNSLPFSFRVVARRKDVTDGRLQVVEIPAPRSIEHIPTMQDVMQELAEIPVPSDFTPSDSTPSSPDSEAG